MSELKKWLARGIRWGHSFAEGVFLDAGFSNHYFFETPLLGRSDIMVELDRLLVPLAVGETFISAAYERDGSFDDGEADVTTWVSHDEHPFSGEGAARFRARGLRGTWDGLIVASNTGNDWILYENPAEPIGVIATRTSLASLYPDPDLVFDVRRFLDLIDSPALGLSDAAKMRFRKTYAQEC